MALQFGGFAGEAVVGQQAACTCWVAAPRIHAAEKLQDALDEDNVHAGTHWTASPIQLTGTNVKLRYES
jgi:hypothetical protein